VVGQTGPHPRRTGTKPTTATPAARHAARWVKGSGRDYVLAVLTNGNVSERVGIDTISHISAVVYSQLRH
jgi:hypothetical protein